MKLSALEIRLRVGFSVAGGWLTPLKCTMLAMHFEFTPRPAQDQHRFCSKDTWLSMPPYAGQGLGQI